MGLFLLFLAGFGFAYLVGYTHGNNVLANPDAFKPMGDVKIFK
jgi:hypothetical protein